MLQPLRIDAIVLALCMTSLCHGQGQKVKSQMKRTEGPVYGKGCGIAGVDPGPRIELEGLLSFRDSLGVVAMLYDTDTVIQVYGAEGVIRLQRSGMVFPVLIQERVEKLRSDERRITVCSGCSYWEMEIREALREKISVNKL